MIHILVIMALIGLAAWLLTAFVPMEPRMKQAISIVAVILALLYALYASGLHV